MQEKNQPLEELEKSGSKIWYYLSAFDKLHTSDPQVREYDCHSFDCFVGSASDFVDELYSSSRSRKW